MNLLKLAAVMLAVTSTAGARGVADCRLVPGWEQEGPARTFVADNLFEYVDGNAEGYLVYGFIRLENVRGCDRRVSGTVFREQSHEISTILTYR